MNISEFNFAFTCNIIWGSNAIYNLIQVMCNVLKSNIYSMVIVYINNNIKPLFSPLKGQTYFPYQ